MSTAQAEGARRAPLGWVARRRGAAARKVAVFILVLGALWGLWELARALGEASGLRLGAFEVNDRTMPHVHDMLRQFVQPSRRNGPLLIAVLLQAAAFTAKEAVVGFLIGATVGFVIGVLLSNFRLLERGLLPYIVASQTVPILAIAPMVVVWMGAGLFSVAVIAAYLTFFPVAINTLRGLRSADPRAHELMASYAADRWRVLWKLEIPASLPYLFTALRIAAPASVVGAIIGELPSSIQGGLAGAILNFNQYYVSNPPALWATNIVAALLGMAFFGAVVLLERLVVHRAPEHVA
ncbi:MAG TPA: ABC transporter permease [Actinomycetota bacterium]|nr:ABC transporter permease [Actinomycetota bacterium]